jgi:Amt family ammonium transporter
LPSQGAFCWYDIIKTTLKLFFTLLHKQGLQGFLILLIWLGYAVTGSLLAQTEMSGTNATAGAVSIDETNAPPVTNASVTNSPPTESPPTNAAPTPATFAAPDTAHLPPTLNPNPAPHDLFVGTVIRMDWPILAALLTLGSIGGFLLYQCGLTRAKNCGHTSTLLLVGLVFGLIGYWMGGFAVETGGIGDAHAALTGNFASSDKSALDHELGPVLAGHHWGLMGSSGFFLITDESARNGAAFLFLGQAALLVIAVSAALGAALERGRLLAMAVAAFLIGAVIYPLFANWVWGGGWLAELGREFKLGHGFVDLAGAGVVHETAGTLALVIAIVLGPRYGKFGRNKSINSLPGHNMPFLILGALVLLISWTITNAFAWSGPESNAGLAAVNALLAGTGGVSISFLLAAGRKQAPQPALLCRGLLGGVVSIFACGALIDPWAAFVMGCLAGWIVQWIAEAVERRRIDDPMSAISVHGAGGAWGVLAAGLFANGTSGKGINGVDGPVRGLLFSGGWHQLAAQAIGAATCFVVVFILGYACLGLIQKILGNRVELVDEIHGLDWIQTGALGYQGDAEPEELPASESDKKKIEAKFSRTA